MYISPKINEHFGKNNENNVKINEQFGTMNENQ